MLHARQHRTQRQLDVRIERQHAERVHLFPQHRLQRPDGLRVRRFPAEICLREAREIIVPGRGVKQVGRQRRVEHEPVRRQALGEQCAHKVFDVVARFAHTVGKQQAQECVVIIAELRPRECIARLTVAERERVEPVGREHRDIRRRRDRLLECVQRGAVRHVHGRQLRQRALRRSRAVGRLQAPLFRELQKAQPPEPVIEFGAVVPIPDRRFGRKINGRVRVNRGEVERQLRALAPFRELFAHAWLDVQRVKIAVNIRHRAEAHEQILRRLFADAGHAGDVVRTVAHERLEVDHMDGIEAILGAKYFGRVFDRLRLAHAGLDVADVGGVRDELEAVLVAGDDLARPAGGLAAPGDRAEQVVRLPPGQLQPPDAHVVKRLLEQRHLHDELLRHGLALGLIERVLLVAERRRVHVKRHAHRLRLLELEDALENGQKAVDRVRRRAVGRVEHADAVKSAVDDAVAVKNHEFHSGILLARHWPRSSMSRSRSTAAYSYSSISAAFFIWASSRAISARRSASVIFTPSARLGASTSLEISSSSRTLLTIVFGTMPCA